MDRVTTIDEIEQDVQAVMRERGVDRDEAETIVGLRRGELLGDGDLLFMRPLTDEQRRALRIGRSIDEVLAADQARECDEESSSRAPATVDQSP